MLGQEKYCIENQEPNQQFEFDRSSKFILKYVDSREIVDTLSSLRNFYKEKVEESFRYIQAL